MTASQILTRCIRNTLLVHTRQFGNATVFKIRKTFMTYNLKMMVGQLGKYCSGSYILRRLHDN